MNVNEYVYVRLTEAGRGLERAWYRQLKLDPDKHIRPAELGGWRQFHLYELMNVFGPEMYVGALDAMFVDNEVLMAPPMHTRWHSAQTPIK